MSAISADLQSVSLNQPVSVVWTYDPIYTQYLVSTFELLWEHAVPATQRIEELLKEGAPEI